MNLIDIILLAIALGIDCMVASFSQGLIFAGSPDLKIRVKNSLRLACVMGLFQGLMPVIGYVGANSLYDFLVPFSKWIVFGIFLVLGLKFILEAFKPKEECVQCIDFKCLIGLGVATSIDALVSGATVRLTGTSLLLACLIIGVASFVMSVIGFGGGNLMKNIPSKVLEIIGGVILILLALKAVI